MLFKFSNPNLALFVLLISLASLEVNSKEVTDCQPCEFLVGKSGHVFDFIFYFDEGGNKRKLKKIDVKHNQRDLQSLTIEGEEEVEGPYDFDVVNVQNASMIYLVTSNGASGNMYADYWIYDNDFIGVSDSQGKSEPFHLLGNFPYLTYDPDRNVFKSHVSGGHGGRSFEKSEYTLENNELKLVYLESQSYDHKADIYLHTIKKLNSNRLVVVVNEKLNLK